MPHPKSKRALAVGLFLALSFVVVVFPDVKVVNAEPNTLVVPDDYSTINAALSSAADGDTIFVKKGEYAETLTIEKAVTLMGEDSKTTVINGQNHGTVILVRHDDVTVTGFTVIYDDSPNSPDPYFLWSSRLAGVHILNVKRCSVYGNRIDDSGCGVWLYGSSENNITGNSIARSDYGIRVDSSDGNIIAENNVTGSWGGIWLISAASNILSGNSMSGNSRNFGVTGSTVSAYINDVDSSNTVDGKPVYYWVNESSRSVPFDAGCVLLVNCTDVTVQGLTLTKNQDGIVLAFTKNSAVTQCTFELNNRDVYLFNSSGVDMIGNKVSSHVGITADGNWSRILGNVVNSSGTGMSIGGFHQTIADNTVSAGTFGGGTSIILCKGSYNNISRNTFSGTSYVSVVLDGSYNLFHENTVTSSDRMRVDGNGNVVAKNSVTGGGLSVSGSRNIVCANRITDGLGLSIVGDNNIFCSNLIANNRVDVSIGGTKERAYNNTVYGNNFVNNTQPLSDYMPMNDANFWDNGREGNYWSHYTGTDRNGDGVGDTAYKLISATFDFELNGLVEFVAGQDNYPRMSPVHNFDAGKWINIFDAGTWESTNYNVDIVSDSTVSGFSFNPEDASIQFSLEGETGTSGFCRVTIPKGMLFAEGEWSVLVDGSPVTAAVNEDADNTYLYFTYSHSTKTVDIIGTEAIPEFPSWAVLPLFLIVALVVAVYKKKLTNTTY